MRLIDADAIPFEQSEDGYMDDVAYRYDINDLPTIDPVNHGSWKKRKCWDKCVCSECGHESETATNLCPNCGARMDNK